MLRRIAQAENSGMPTDPKKLQFLLPDSPYRSYREYLEARGNLPALPGINRVGLIQEIIDSGLRGRGGGGFSTGKKWQTLYQHPCRTHDVVCNAAEGEPGTFKDRFLSRVNPYAILEGMALAVHVVRARAAYIAVKASFRDEIARLESAADELRAAGYFKQAPLRIVTGPEEYLFGEEKALLNVIENEGPFPRAAEYPPYEVGLFATPDSPNPALVNNAQTFAHVAMIARSGSSSFRELGSPDTPGTLIFTLCGNIQRPGIYEVPAGLTLERLIDEHGKGLAPGRKPKVILSGVSGSFYSAKKMSAKAEFASGIGAAGLIVVDDATPMLPVLRAITRFLYVESCSQCSACKSGLGIACNGLMGKLNSDELIRVREAAESAPQGNRCFLPVQGAKIIPGLVKMFSRELKKPSDNLPEWPLPKIVSYDASRHRFEYDRRQASKQPDWSYQEEGDQASAG